MELDLGPNASWWTVMTALAGGCSFDHHQFTDDEYSVWSRYVEVARRGLKDRPPSGPDEGHLKMIRFLTRHDAPVRVHAVAWAVDLECHAVFTDGWLAQHPDVFTPPPNDWYPVPSWDGTLRGKPSRNPANFVRAGEFPHVRRYQPDVGLADPIEFVFDPTHEIELAGALEGIQVVATVHPNDAWTELDYDHGPSAYPVAPNPDDQLDRLQRGIAAALEADAGVVVAGELCSNPEIEAALADWLDAGDHFGIVVAGSRHTSSNGEPSNLATTHLPGVPSDTPTLTHHKIIPFTAELDDAPSREGISPGPRRLHVQVAGNYRFATLICKDFLDDDVKAAIARAGVNVLAVPAMSAQMDSYPNEVSGYVLATQGIAAVANNPARGPSGSAIEPAAVFGQPVRGDTEIISPPGPRPDDQLTLTYTLESPSPTWILTPEVID